MDTAFGYKSNMHNHAEPSIIVNSSLQLLVVTQLKLAAIMKTFTILAISLMCLLFEVSYTLIDLSVH